MPFSGFDDWDDCLDTMMNEEGHDEQSAESICGALQAEAKSDAGDPEALLDALKSGSGLIADVGVDLVSGVDVPAVDSKWVMLKSGGGRKGHDYRVNTPILLDKADGDDGDGDSDGSDKRISYAAAMIPREPDKEGDVAPTPTVEAAAHDFLKSDGGIDTDHSLIDGEGTPVESWVLKQPREFDLPDGGTESYPEGTWMLGVEWGAEAWDRIKSGELTGLSIYGMAEHVPLSRVAKCAECGGELSATKSQNGDNGKRGESDSGDMGQTDNDGSDGGTDADGSGAGADGGGADDGPTLKDLHDTVSALSETVETVKESVETEKQDLDDAAAVVADQYDMAPGEVLDIMEAMMDTDTDAALEAIQSASSSSESKEDDGDGEEDDDDEMDKGDGDANLSKGYDGEGTRQTQAEKNVGESAGSDGLPSFSDIAAAEAEE